jgi:hypothetical protein
MTPTEIEALAEPGVMTTTDTAPQPEAPAPEPEPESVVEAPIAEAAPPVIDMAKYIEREQFTAALRETREKARQERTQYERKFAELEALLKASAQPKAEPKAEDDPAPDPDVDPVAAVKWLHRERQREIKRMEARHQAEEQVAEVTARQQQVLSRYTAEAQEFAQGEPTFGEAYNYLREHRAKELWAFGIRDMNHLGNVLRKEEADLAEAAMHNGVNPAQALYEAAKLRGFAPVSGTAPEPQQATPQRDPATGQFLPATAPAPSKVPTRNPPGSISGLPGVPGGQMTATAVLDMPAEDFRKFGGNDFTNTWRRWAKGK